MTALSDAEMLALHRYTSGDARDASRASGVSVNGIHKRWGGMGLSAVHAGARTRGEWDDLCMACEGDPARIGEFARDVTPEKARRAWVRLGMIPRKPVRQYDVQRLERLLDDGLPDTWVAEEMGLPLGLVHARAQARGGSLSGWGEVWGGIVKSPPLLALHREIAPPSRAQLFVAGT